ncbi:MAG TPA: hypothetical protein PLP01_11325 [Phycisphaerae bacterium]|nr:hypothetical protein [Phycisphaerae bacterium]HOI55831.1 hypothetical protein [Phycisphaerae bacterium]
MNILFIGNSFTYFNDLPAAVAALCESRGVSVHVGRYIRGGAGLETHWLDNLGIAEGRHMFCLEPAPERKGGLDDALAERRWDWVVLQGHSRDPLLTPEDFAAYGRRLHDAAATNGARTMLYQTFAHQTRPDDQPAISDAYRRLAAELGAALAPVGDAWAAAFAARPGLVLHHEDQLHPNDKGSYLAACVFAAKLTAQDPRGLPHELDAVRNDKGDPCYALDSDSAWFLQDIAAQIVQHQA